MSRSCRRERPRSRAPAISWTPAAKSVGEHPGVAFFTIGQRKRLPASTTGALFVLSLDAETNTVVVGGNEDLFASGLAADTCVWSAIPGLSGVQCPLAVTAKIRYNGSAEPARLWPGGNEHEATAKFEAPQRAITPGQSAVFYGGEGPDAGQVVIGGGLIVSAVRE